MLKLLIAVIVLDYVTGILKAIYNKQLSSEIGVKGIIHKILYLIIVALACLVESATNITIVRSVCIMFFFCNESISILENVSQMGVKVPKKLKEILLQLRNEKEERE